MCVCVYKERWCVCEERKVIVSLSPHTHTHSSVHTLFSRTTERTLNRVQHATPLEQDRERLRRQHGRPLQTDPGHLCLPRYRLKRNPRFQGFQVHITRFPFSRSDGTQFLSLHGFHSAGQDVLKGLGHHVELSRIIVSLSLL